MRLLAFNEIASFFKGIYIEQEIEAGTSYSVTSRNNINVAIILQDVLNEKLRSFIILPPHSTIATSHPVSIPLQTSDIIDDNTATKLQNSYVNVDKSSNLSAVQLLAEESSIAHAPDKYSAITVVFGNNNKWLAFPGTRPFDVFKETVCVSLQKYNVENYIFLFVQPKHILIINRKNPSDELVRLNTQNKC